MSQTTTRRGVLSGLAASLGAPALLRPGRAESAAPAVSITPNTEVGLAPWGVFFEARATGFAARRPLHDLRYRWSFGDPGEWALLDPRNPFGRDRNVAYGPWCVHTFTRPGVYTVACEVTDGRARATGRTRIEIRDPDVFFRRRTVVVSQSGDFTGAPAGAAPVRSLREAVDATTPGRPPWRPVRILLRAGETFDTEDFSGFAGYMGLYVGAFGPGPRPVLLTRAEPLRIREMGGFGVFADLDVKGFYDGARGSTGLGPGSERGGFSINSYGRHPLTVHNCRSGGHGVGLSVGDSLGRGMPELVLSEFDMTDWKAFGVALGFIDRGGMVACRLAMQPDASTGPGGRRDPTDPDWTDHGPYRDGNMGRFTIHHCEMFSKAGWSNIMGIEGGAHQQCIRLQSGGSPGAMGMVERCVLEGGFSVINAFANAAKKINHPQNYIIEKNYLLGTANTQSFIDLGFGGTTIRNNVMVMPDVPHEHIGFVNFIGYPVAAGGNAPDNALPSRVYNNTFVDLRGPANGLARHYRPVSGIEEPGRVVLVANNLEHVPDLGVDMPSQAPLESAPALFAPRYEGEWYDGRFDPAHATPPGTPASFRPLPGSPALGAAEGEMVALDDITGRLREGPTAAGAFHDTDSRLGRG